MTDRLLIVDFGSQVTQLIARRVREAGVYCEILPFQAVDDAKIKAFNPLIPGDAERSGLPMAALTYEVTNTSNQPLTVSVAGSMRNFVGARRIGATKQPDRQITWKSVQSLAQKHFPSVVGQISGLNPRVSPE